MYIYYKRFEEFSSQRKIANYCLNLFDHETTINPAELLFLRTHFEKKNADHGTDRGFTGEYYIS